VIGSTSPARHTLVRDPQAISFGPPAVRRRRRLRRLPLFLVVPLLMGLIGGPVTPAGADELSDALARQQALQQQIKNQKAAVDEINAMQADLAGQITSTKKALEGINADLAFVRKSIDEMVVKIEAVKQQYLALVARLELLETQLVRIKTMEQRKRGLLTQRKALLAERIRTAYDTDRTSMLETFLSGDSFTDVLSEVSYSIDAGEQDRALAEQIVRDQEELAAIHETVVATKDQTETLRVETERQRVELDRQLGELKAAQEHLRRLEAETAKALAIQKAAYTKLARNKDDLAKAIATTQAAQKALSKQINNLVAEQYALGNIPSQYNGQFVWPLSGSVSGEFGCSSYPGYAPGYGCAHFHNGIDIVAPSGCGAPIKAAGSGRIAYVGWNYADGADPAWIVIIAHSSNLTTWYAHMKANSFPGGISQGSVVNTGQVIGFEGNTGNSTGCHLHWMVEVDGTWKNPRLFV
jgi:murein DD-endopeptidase MepM/ murein hydrolase activator NlpD